MKIRPPSLLLNDPRGTPAIKSSSALLPANACPPPNLILVLPYLSRVLSVVPWRNSPPNRKLCLPYTQETLSTNCHVWFGVVRSGQPWLPPSELNPLTAISGMPKFSGSVTPVLMWYVMKGSDAWSTVRMDCQNRL